MFISGKNYKIRIYNSIAIITAMLLVYTSYASNSTNKYDNTDSKRPSISRSIEDNANTRIDKSILGSGLTYISKDININNNNASNKVDSIDIQNDNWNIIGIYPKETYNDTFNITQSIDKTKIKIEYIGEKDYGIASIQYMSDKSQYIINKSEVIALTLGNGAYQVKLYDIMGDITNAKFSGEITILGPKINNQKQNDGKQPISVYTGATYYSDYSNASEEFESLLNRLYTQSDNTLDFILSCYNYVCNIAYDDEKSYAITSGQIKRYKPDINRTIESNLGICTDKSALLASLLRAKGIPTKVVFGYYEDMYHAWNEFFINNEWFMLDATRKIKYDSPNVYSYKVQKYN